MHRFLILVPVLLAACASPAPAPTHSALGDVQVGDKVYPIASSENGVWHVDVDGLWVVCTAPTHEACYWSVRHAQNAQDQLDDLG